jgi:hypothetical protein
MKAMIFVLYLLAVPSFSLAQEETCEGTTYDTSMRLLRVLKKVEVELNDTHQRALAAARRTTLRAMCKPCELLSADGYSIVMRHVRQSTDCGEVALAAHPRTQDA